VTQRAERNCTRKVYTSSILDINSAPSVTRYLFTQLPLSSMHRSVLELTLAIPCMQVSLN